MYKCKLGKRKVNSTLKKMGIITNELVSQLGVVMEKQYVFDRNIELGDII